MRNLQDLMFKEAIMNHVIIINGKGGAGKDTFIQLCQNYSDDIINISSVDFVKEVAHFCGWQGEKDVSARKFLSDIKDALTNWKDIPFQKMLQEADKYDDKIIFIHVREPHEIDKLKKALNAKTLLIKNPKITSEFGNHADDMVEKYEYDYTINNVNTLQTLEESAKIFVDIVKNS